MKYKHKYLIDVIIDHCLDLTIHFISSNSITYFNLLTKSQVSFKIETPFPDIINYTVTTKDKSLIIIGEDKAFEFLIAAN